MSRSRDNRKRNDRGMTASGQQPQRQGGGGHARHRTAEARGPQQSVSLWESYQGPLPHPEHLAKIEEIAPGSSTKIIDEFVAQGQHRRVQEDRVVSGIEQRAGVGQYLGFVLLLAAIIAGVIIALMTSARVGGAVIGAAIASGALIYVIGGRPPRSE